MGGRRHSKVQWLAIEGKGGERTLSESRRSDKEKKKKNNKKKTINNLEIRGRDR
jgi:hypothetical protein